MRIRIVNQPTGCINARPWPEPGECIDLPAAAVEAMIAAGDAVEVVEKRPAPKSGVETRAKKD